MVETGFRGTFPRDFGRQGVVMASSTDLAVLRALARLPEHWRPRGRPTPLPVPVRRFVDQAEPDKLRTLLVEVATRLEQCRREG